MALENNSVDDGRQPKRPRCQPEHVNPFEFEETEKRARVISIYNHKGGVGKTTTVASLAWKLASEVDPTLTPPRIPKVCVVDFDTQCNLTGFLVDPGMESLRALGSFNYLAGAQDPVEAFYANDTTRNCNVFSTFSPWFKQEFATAHGLGVGVDHIQPTPFKVADRNLFIPNPPQTQPNAPNAPNARTRIESLPQPPADLYLLGGHQDFDEFEAFLHRRYSVEDDNDFPYTPGCMFALFRRLRVPQTTEHFDYILCDLSPSASLLNQIILCSSDYVLVPAGADYFSHMGISGLARKLPHWCKTQQKKAQSLIEKCPGAPNTEVRKDFQVPFQKPIFLGHTIQIYSKTSGRRAADGLKGAPSHSFMSWINRIRDSVSSALIVSLEHQFSLPVGNYVAREPHSTFLNFPECANDEYRPDAGCCRGWLINQQSLGPVSTGTHIPAFALNDDAAALIHERVPSTAKLTEAEKNNQKMMDDFFSSLADLLRHPCDGVVLAELRHAQRRRSVFERLSVKQEQVPSDLHVPQMSEDSTSRYNLLAPSTMPKMD